jgi:hypothetical protein
MKAKNLIIILLIGIFLTLAIFWFFNQENDQLPETGYKIEEGKVFYVEGICNSETCTTMEHKIEEADANSFKDIGFGYAKDKNFLYHRLSIFDNFIINDGLEALSENYLKDNQFVYFKKLSGDENIVKIEQADSNSFTVFQKEYVTDNRFFAKDKQNVFYLGEIVEGADNETFTLLGDYYAKDKNNAYYMKKIINGVDLSTFKTYEHDNSACSCAKDKNHIYQNGKIITPEDEWYKCCKEKSFFDNLLDKLDL